jgi:hypothetical protein
MLASLRYAPSSNRTQISNSFLSNLVLWLPNLLKSVFVSIVGSIALTLLSYGLSTTVGFPIMPFVLIMI